MGNQARHDFETAERELHVQGWPDVICFHCQQTVEKLLKGMLVAHGQDITRYRIHDLTQLLNACRPYERRLISLKPACKQLTGFYIAARYPVGASYTQADARRAVVFARKALRLAEQLLHHG